MRAIQRKVNSPADLIKIENKTHSLAALSRIASEKFTLTMLRTYIVELNEFLNVARPMKDKQVDQTSEMILDEFPLMTMTDVVYTFKKAKMGEFGALYEGIDGLKILNWFRQVWAERLQAAEYESEREHYEAKANINDLAGNERTCNKTSIRELFNRANGWSELQKAKK